MCTLIYIKIHYLTNYNVFGEGRVLSCNRDEDLEILPPPPNRDAEMTLMGVGEAELVPTSL
jgi:hypothetical protein